MTAAPAYPDFASRVGTDFGWRLPDGQMLPLRLVECRATGPDGSGASFVLTFKAGPDAPIEQSTYQLCADGLAPQPIFLVPVQRLPDGVLYEAVFTHLSG